MWREIASERNAHPNGLVLCAKTCYEVYRLPLIRSLTFNGGLALKA